MARWKIFFEKPDFDPDNASHRFICRNVDGIVPINRHLAERIMNEYGIPPERVEVMRFYSDIKEFRQHETAKIDARRRLGLPENAYIVMYIGKLFPGQLESKYIMEAAALCPDKMFVMVGARAHVAVAFEGFLAERGIKNVAVVGFQPFVNLYYYAQSADVLVSYYENSPFSAYQRVPAKLALYTCAKRPIVLADLPGMRCLFGEEEVYFAKPDSPKDLAGTIEHVASNPEEAEKKAAKVYEYAVRNDLSNMGRGVLDFIERVTKNESRQSREARA